MENMINIGIDLGTTNSAIAKFVKGEVTVYKNPSDWKQTLASVVGFKKDRIFVGSKAKELAERAPKDVVSIFKRKMGTTESYRIKAIDKSLTPVDLSAIVLKELKTFVPQEQLESAVITIPASFDTTQSNATKQAGLDAGFKQVILLQEPIAASLAYANMRKENELQDGKWLVYDLGGGTFDVALIGIKDGEMKVIDHEGDNYLGGADFDRMIVEKILTPKIESNHSFTNLLGEMQSASGAYNVTYLTLLRKAEEAKILLSAKTSADIEIAGFEDEDGEEVDVEYTITRSEFNELSKPVIDATIEMINSILTRNALKSTDLLFALMVGGSTFIPYVRQRVEEVLQIPVNIEIDPTTAVAVGAAYFAATRKKEIADVATPKSQGRISIRSSYAKVSKEKEELFSARVSGELNGLSYRIIREDGGFDSGTKRLTERIIEDLPLVENAYNFFNFTVYDAFNNIVETDIEPIGINSGFGVNGQPLPEDISLEVDDDDNPGETKLLEVFRRNQVLPAKRMITRTLNKSVAKGSNDEVIRIRVFEGPAQAIPEANKLIGYIDLRGTALERDVHKGSDIELTITMSESRDLTVFGYLSMADQEFKETFSGKLRDTPVNALQDDITTLSAKLDLEIEQASATENYEAAKKLHALKKEMESVSEGAESLSADDVTDKRYQLEDKKRKIAQAISSATQDKRTAAAKSAYFETKERCERLVNETGNDHERKHFNDIVAAEPAFLSSSNPQRIEDHTDELHSISIQILWRTPGFLIGMFENLAQRTTSMNDQNQVKSLLDAGRMAIENQNWDRLKEINSGLLNQLPNHPTPSDIATKIGF